MRTCSQPIQGVEQHRLGSAGAAGGAQVVFAGPDVNPKQATPLPYNPVSPMKARQHAIEKLLAGVRHTRVAPWRPAEVHGAVRKQVVSGRALAHFVEARARHAHLSQPPRNSRGVWARAVQRPRADSSSAAKGGDPCSSWNRRCGKRSSARPTTLDGHPIHD